MYNSESGYGKFVASVLAQAGQTYGKVFVVCPNTDPNYQYLSEIMKSDPEGVERFFKTFEEAQDAVTTNAGDIIAFTAHSSHTVASMVTTSKNRVTYIGLDGGGRAVTQGTKISLSDATTAVAATITNTGTRNRFINLKITNSGTDAASIAGMIDEGEGTYMKNCNVAKYTDLNVATVADFICRADGFTYEDCEFGFDTLVQSAARATFWIKTSGGKRMKYARVRNCRFVCASSEITKSHILVADTSSLAFTNLFEDCKFLNAIVGSASAARLSDAITSVSGLAEGNLFFVNPASDTTEFCSTVTDNVRVCGAVTANAATGESADAA